MSGTAPSEGLSDATDGHGGEVPSPRKRIGLKKNFGWALAGNIVYQGSRWANLVVLTKLLGPESVGRFALAVAIGGPISVLFSLNLRIVQVTDARDEHRFGHFLGTQLGLSCLALATIVGVVLFGDLNPETARILLVCGLTQNVVVVRSVFLGYSQKHERMDVVATSHFLLGCSSIAAMGLLVWATGDLLVGVLGVLAATVGVLVFWDVRSTRRLVRERIRTNPTRYLLPVWEPRTMLSLARLGLPLGAASGLNSVFVNVPRYAVALLLGEAALGFFAPIMALPLAGKTAIHAATISVLPRLSRYYLQNQRAYVRLLIRLVVAGAALGLAGLALAALFGSTLLTVLFTEEYTEYTDVLLWAMGFGVLTYVVTFLVYGVTAMRYFWVQPIGNGLALVTAVLIAFGLMADYGLVAAVWCIMGGVSAQGILAVIVISAALSRSDKRRPLPTDAQEEGHE